MGVEKDKEKTYRFFSRMETTRQILWGITVVGFLVCVLAIFLFFIGCAAFLRVIL